MVPVISTDGGTDGRDGGPRCGPGVECPSGYTCCETDGHCIAPHERYLCPQPDGGTGDGGPRCGAGVECPPEYTCCETDGHCIAPNELYLCPQPDGGTGHTCRSSADCGRGEMCTGPEGCGVTWTCQPAGPCTDDHTAYCSCRGVTVRGSGSCPPEPYAHRGLCDSPPPPPPDGGTRPCFSDLDCEAGRQLCCTATGTCYDASCLGCCM